MAVRRVSALRRGVRRRGFVVTAVVLLTALAGACGADERGAEDGVGGAGADGTASTLPPAQPQDEGVDDAAWRAALATADERPVRVVLVTDSIGELSGGFGGTWRALQAEHADAPLGSWWPPRLMGGAFAWPALAGREAPVGLDHRGQVLVEADGPVGFPDEPFEVPTTLDVFYSAAPDGGTLEVTVDGTVVDAVDTSLDEQGVPVERVRPAQRWRSPVVAGRATWTVAVAGEGTVSVESVATPPAAGFDVHGKGHAGLSTRDILDAGQAVAHVEAMVARGEPPDLVVWAADTADGEDFVPDLVEAVGATKRAAPGASIALYVPPGHENRTGWPAVADAMRRLAVAEGLLVIDAERAIGDVSRGAPAADLTTDGVHFDSEGSQRLTEVWLAALRPS